MEEAVIDKGMEMKKSQRLKEEKREKIREVKRLANIDAYDGDQDSLSVSEADETIENMLLFMTNPLVKSKLKPAEFKKINNALIDILDTLEIVETRERKKFKKV